MIMNYIKQFIFKLLIRSLTEGFNPAFCIMILISKSILRP